MQILLSTSVKTALRFVDDKHPAHSYIGVLTTPRCYTSFTQLEDKGMVWAADNDCFNGGLDESAFTNMLECISARRSNGFKFVTIPDVVGDAESTLVEFEKWRGIGSFYGLPIALVGQDGMTEKEVPWDQFEAFFIGGSTEWKLGDNARALAQEARSRGMWVHMGRVNSQKRIKYAYSIGCNSVDGTGISRFCNTYVPRMQKIIEELVQNETR